METKSKSIPMEEIDIFKFSPRFLSVVVVVVVVDG